MTHDAPSDHPSPTTSQVSPDAPGITVRPGIRLGQFLKYAGLVDTGADARELVAGGDVLVDGEPETRRGRQLHGGELVEVDTVEGRAAALVVVEDGPAH